MNKLTKILGSGVFGLATVVLPAQGADKVITRSSVVQYSDLDLSKPAGVRTLYLRIKDTATELCGPANVHGFPAFLEYRACVRKAVDDAVGVVNRPMLSDLHRTNPGLRGSSG